MKIKEIIGWLSSFKGEDDLSIVIADTKKRIIHNPKNVMFCSDEPAIFIETVESEALDE